jgi:F0F1-type ATP synthase assembly protein I
MTKVQPPDRPPLFARQLSLAMELPLVLVGGLIVFGGLGYVLDRWLHTSPVLTVIFAILGFAGGMWNAIKLLSQTTGNKKRDG